MQLMAVQTLWEWQNPPHKFYEEFRQFLPDSIDVKFLWDMIIFELGEMETVDCNSQIHHYHWTLFFRKWQLPIKMLCETLEYDYNPLENMNYQVTRNLGRDVIRELGQDIVGNLTSAIKHALDETRTYNDNQSGNDNRTIGEHEVTDEDMTYTDRHYVSAYNQITPPDADTYSDRDTGNRNTDTDRNTDRTDNLKWDSTKKSTDVTEKGATDDRTDKTTTNKTENETTGTKESEGTRKVGLDRDTYQNLTEQQRKVVVFNIYNWIIDKAAKELVIAVF